MNKYWKEKFYQLVSLLVVLLFCSASPVFSQSETPVLPGEGGPQKAVVLDYFPDRLHAFVFKNWPLVSVERLAKVLLPRGGSPPYPVPSQCRQSRNCA